MEYLQSGLLIKQIHDCLEKRGNNTLRPKGLTMMQVSVLMTLQEAPQKQLSMKNLEHIFQVAQSTVAGIIARLEQKGLVEALGDASDRRIKLAHITPAGEALCREATRHMHDTEEMLLRGFSQEEQHMFNTLLMKAADNIK